MTCIIFGILFAFCKQDLYVWLIKLEYNTKLDIFIIIAAEKILRIYVSIYSKHLLSVRWAGLNALFDNEDALIGELDIVNQIERKICLSYFRRIQG